LPFFDQRENFFVYIKIILKMSYGGTLYGGARRRKRAHPPGSFPWQEFLRQNGEFRAFMDQMSALYRQQVGEGQPLDR